MENQDKRPENDFLEQIKTVFDCGSMDVRTYSPLALAYIGDGVYDLIIRSVVVERANRPAGRLHRITVQYVKAQAQARIIDSLLPCLTEEEETVYRRGRNANPHTVARNASRTDYRKATGFEALIGYLYLTGRTDRLLFLVRQGIGLADMQL